MVESAFTVNVHMDELGDLVITSQTVVVVLSDLTIHRDSLRRMSWLMHKLHQKLLIF